MRAHRALPLLLRVVGFVSGLAIFAVFMPRSWMASCHEWLGLGTLPEGPITEYLARTVSAFYAVLGGLMWLAAGNIRRYAAVITYLAMVFILFGLVVLVIDIRLGLPAWWVLGEGPFVMAMGAVFLALQAKARWRHAD